VIKASFELTTSAHCRIFDIKNQYFCRYFADLIVVQISFLFAIIKISAKRRDIKIGALAAGFVSDSLIIRIGYNAPRFRAIS